MSRFTATGRDYTLRPDQGGARDYRQINIIGDAGSTPERLLRDLVVIGILFTIIIIGGLLL